MAEKQNKTYEMENQTRREINQIILKLPKHQLKPILMYLYQAEKTEMKQWATANLIKKIFTEDAELLKKLAQ